MVSRLARFLGLPEQLAAAVRRRRGDSDGQMLLALIYAACAGGGQLHAVAALGAEGVARRACGLRAVPASRRLGEYLQRMHEAALEGLRRCARLVSRRLVPVCTVVPVSRDRLPLAELGRRHRGQQGPEPAFQGPLTDLGLQPPPCRSHAAQQGFYLGARIAQLLRLLPSEARRPGLHCVDSVGRLTCSARLLLCSRSNLRWDWLLHAASRREPGWGWGPTRSPRGSRCVRSRVRSGRGAGAGRLRGAQVARRRAEGPAPSAQGSPLKPYGPATAISGNYPGI